MRKTKTETRSVTTPGSPKINPSGLPYGAGSFQKRGASLWIIYRDVEGRTIQYNAKTTDPAIARLMVAEKALDAARARVAALEAIFDEAKAQGYAPAVAGWEFHGHPGVQHVRKRQGGGSPGRGNAGRGTKAAGKTAEGGDRK